MAAEAFLSDPHYPGGGGAAPSRAPYSKYGNPVFLYTALGLLRTKTAILASTVTVTLHMSRSEMGRSAGRSARWDAAVVVEFVVRVQVLEREAVDDAAAVPEQQVREDEDEYPVRLLAPAELDDRKPAARRAGEAAAACDIGSPRRGGGAPELRRVLTRRAAGAPKYRMR